MNNIKLTIVICFILVFATGIEATIKLKWSATAGETKRMDEILVSEGNYTINWGDGTDETTTKTHKYEKAGEYTVTVSGSVTSFKLTDSSNSGVTSIEIPEEDNTLETLLIWTNPSLKTLNINNARALKKIDATLLSFNTLDISGNTNLEHLDIKMSSITDFILARDYPQLRFIDMNNGKVEACSMNQLFNALPDLAESGESGTIYSVSCTGDATSDPTIAKTKGWIFGNGGLGNGSAECNYMTYLEVPENIQSENIQGTGNYTITWDNADGAESYSVRVCKKDGSLCEDIFYFTTSNSIVVENIPVAEDYYFTVYSVLETNFARGESYQFDGTPVVGIEELEIFPERVYAIANRIIIENADPGKNIAVYQLNGALFASQSSSGQEQIEFVVKPNSVYIVKVGQRAYKLVVSN